MDGRQLIDIPKHQRTHSESERECTKLFERMPIKAILLPDIISKQQKNNNGRNRMERIEKGLYQVNHSPKQFHRRMLAIQGQGYSPPL